MLKIKYFIILILIFSAPLTQAADYPKDFTIAVTNNVITLTGTDNNKTTEITLPNKAKQIINQKRSAQLFCNTELTITDIAQVQAIKQTAKQQNKYYLDKTYSINPNAKNIIKKSLAKFQKSFGRRLTALSGKMLHPAMRDSGGQVERSFILSE